MRHPIDETADSAPQRGTLHGVVNPPSEMAPGSRRQSIIFLHNPNYDAEVSCIPSCTWEGNPPKYPPTRSGEHRRNQFVRTKTENLNAAT